MMQNNTLPALGLDIGSTTAKIVLIEHGKIIYQKYERHFSQIRSKLLELLDEVSPLLSGRSFMAALSGSAGMGLAESSGIPFVQEVYAAGEVVRSIAPDVGTVIELGGEDAKVIFFKGGMEERMNGSCAGGTGAFIDQMATLLNLSVEEMDALSFKAERIYPIASRCGVFAKTDIQSLLNQGAAKSDVAASIYQAVVNQTIAGLVQGRKIEPKVMFLGGPLYYCKGLRERFKETLNLNSDTAVFPEYGRFAVAVGSALYSAKAGTVYTYDSLIKAVSGSANSLKHTGTLPPLFKSAENYAEFKSRHEKNSVPYADPDTYSGDAWLGIDCGSTTTKLILLTPNKELLYTYYNSNNGNPVEIIRAQLEKIYAEFSGRINIRGSAVTGYGEELIKNAFHIDRGVVETIAHYTAAKYFRPDVDFIIDIGGQDIKCFKIKNGAIDSIVLNEACSSGCGSFIETFAKSMGYTASEFAALGIKASSPVNLGSRCTVFMNSSVKQSQKDGASIEDISAGLSVSVIKNAIYKVIRANSPEELGQSIVVQGGTFYNDAVLRAFEMEMNCNVIRPSIAGLMGAYGAALYAMDINSSSILSADALKNFAHTTKSAVCGGCTNHCHLTINIFSDGKRLVSGNQCEKGAGTVSAIEKLPNLYEYKRNYLMSIKSTPGKRGKIGFPLALGMYELAPLWHGLFTSLGFEVVLSGLSTRRTYEKGQFSIPSDTACYPAKIMHGHIEQLLENGINTIFYPCLSYNIDEKNSDNHYNCPVVAYYSELLHGNMENLQKIRFLYPFLNINNKRELAKELYTYLKPFYHDISFFEIQRAVKHGFAEYNAYMKSVRTEGENALKYAREHGKRIAILAGRPYHIDPEINHGIDKLSCSLGFVTVSEDSVCHLVPRQSVHVLNQWTYHARLYQAARYAAEHDDTELIQLVSFGCGVDAITTDEVRAILEKSGKYYTQLKIDEITNLGAVKIRLRSLIGALDEKRRQ